jgi:hypothetical protein
LREGLREFWDDALRDLKKTVEHDMYEQESNV